MKLSTLIIPIALLAMVSVGCKKDDAATTAPNTPATAGTDKAAADTKNDTAAKLVGTWTNDSKDMKDSTVEFKADGTMSISGTAMEADKVVGTVAAEGTYKVEGDMVKTKPTSMKMTAPEGADEATKKKIDEQNKAMGEAVKSIPEDSSKIEWKSDDLFTFTNQGGSNPGKVTTFTRKK